VFAYGRAYKFFNISIKVGIESKFYDVLGEVRTSSCGSNMWQESVTRRHRDSCGRKLFSDLTCARLGMPSIVLHTMLYFVDRCYVASSFVIHSTYFTMLLQLLNLRGLEYDGIEFESLP